AIDPHRARSEFFQINHGAKGATDEPLDLGAAPIEPAFADVARLSGGCRVRQHRILRRQPTAGHPALAGFLHPAWDRLFDHHATDHPRVAHRNENRAAGVWCDVQIEMDRSNLIVRAAVSALHPAIVGQALRLPTETYPFTTRPP